MRLNFRSGSLDGRTVEVTGDRFVLGRAIDSDLSLPDSKVSRHHAELVRRGDVWAVRDLDSSNGTFVDGRAVTGEVVLHGGETLRVGDHEATVELDAPVAAPAPRHRGYTTLLRRTDERVRRATIVAGVAVLIAGGLAAAAVAGVFGGGSGGDGLDVRALVRTATPSTLRIAMAAGGRPYAGGSGWVLDAEAGEIVTNGHVASAGTSAAVALAGERERDAEIVGMDVCQDVALLRTSDTSGLRTMPQSRQRDVAAGDPVVALGSLPRSRPRTTS
ncbi:MAG TPA: FHA domain-containing protein [Solirubrobacteraceae bacterium]|nr:FHA domain-containing protein [Solirubrobacteraceae bacterium]